MTSFKSSLDRFQGCLMGALIGDCLGVPFEGTAFAEGKGIAKQRVVNAINPSHLSTKKKGSKRYSDDTAMTKSICASLLHCKKFDPVDMATRFTKDYVAEKNRGYGQGVRDVFNAWAGHGINYKNVYMPSIMQFDQSGSYGNGAAMRVHPVALYSKSVKECIEVAKESGRLTHNHQHGYMGAILIAIATYKCLYTSKPIKVNEFLQDLKEEICVLENVENTTKDSNADEENIPEVGLSESDPETKLHEWTRSASFSFTKQLNVIEELLAMHSENENEDDTVAVIRRLGRDVSAQQAVPAAIYSFLRNLDSNIEETLYYAISLGGDTDTIGTMCLAMAGAYHGFASIPESWKDVCESSDEMKLFAERFYEIHVNTSS